MCFADPWHMLSLDMMISLKTFCDKGSFNLFVFQWKLHQLQCYCNVGSIMMLKACNCWSDIFTSKSLLMLSVSLSWYTIKLTFYYIPTDLRMRSTALAACLLSSGGVSHSWVGRSQWALLCRLRCCSLLRIDGAARKWFENRKFPGGHPSNYLRSQTLLNFIDHMTGVSFKVI